MSPPMAHGRNMTHAPHQGHVRSFVDAGRGVLDPLRPGSGLFVRSSRPPEDPIRDQPHARSIGGLKVTGGMLGIFGALLVVFNFFVLLIGLFANPYRDGFPYFLRNLYFSWIHMGFLGELLFVVLGLFSLNCGWKLFEMGRTSERSWFFLPHPPPRYFNVDVSAMTEKAIAEFYASRNI